MLNIKKIGLVLAVLPFQLLAQQSPVSLDTVLRRIERNNLLLQTYALKAESFKHKAKAGTAWMAPMVGVGTFMTPYPGIEVMDERDKGSIMFQLEQDIPNPGKLNAQRRYIESKGLVELAGKGIALNDFKAQAKRLYYTWIVASQRIQVFRENDKIMQMMKKIEQIRYPYNQSQLSGVFRANAKIEENQNMIRMQQGDISKAKAWLNSLMNLPGNQDLEIDTAYIPQFFAESSIDTALLAGQRKDIVQMEQNIRSMKLGITAMRAQAKPDFRIRFDHMSPLSKMMPKAYSVMGMISVPIVPWSSKMYKSEVKAMNYEIQAMEKQRAGMLQESQGMLYGMQYEIQSMQKRITAMEEKIIPALKKTMDADFVNYQENKLQLTAVINSWEALTMMQNTVLDEKMKLYQMIVDYEKELYR
ncbi:TolC family protein [Pedobacter nutrimenti]|uniref:Outer membrane protein TolC n=1 Tax=Pedobacter nutrimenti TaxID=1241337 RepID=A0A318USS6_9SPHI|nr:TolC family protein [Pedobacter nutrimenti]PYF74659.1 outer membrane protein TolC [Pedobacter nutrimenti]